MIYAKIIPSSIETAKCAKTPTIKPNVPVYTREFNMVSENSSNVLSVSPMALVTDPYISWTIPATAPEKPPAINLSFASFTIKTTFSYFDWFNLSPQGVILCQITPST
jgi:hypothetical protein